MKNKLLKIIATLLVLFLSASVMPACNIKKNISNGNITIIVDNKEKALYERLIKEFEEETEYTVTPLWTSGADIQSTQATKIGTRNAPDVIIGGDTYTEVYKRSLLDLSELIERDGAEVDAGDFVDGVMERMSTSEGKAVFMPLYFNISLLYYNKDLFDEKSAELMAAGITAAPDGTAENNRHYPHENWTIEDFFKAGGILTKMSGGSYTQWGSTTVRNWWGEWLIHLRQAGDDLFDDAGYVKLSAQAKQGLQVYYDKSYGNPSLNRPKISSGTGESDFGGFQSKRCAMDYGGHTANWPVYDGVQGLNWGITVLPTGVARRKGAEFAIGGLGIFKDSPDKEAAWGFIKFLTGKDGIKKFVDNGSMVIRKSVFNSMQDGIKKERTKIALDAINKNGPYGDYAMTLPKLEYFTEVALNIIESSIGLMMANDSSRISIDVAADRIVRESNDYIDLNYR